MKSFASMKPALILAVCLSISLAGSLSAADPSDEELKRKAAEVERLKSDLEKAQNELKSLKADNQKLRAEKDQVVTAATQAGVVVVQKPSKPLVEVPPVNPSDTLDVRDVVLYYQTDPAGAAQRFTNQKFRVRGVVDGFGRIPAVHAYHLYMESPDKRVKVRFTLGFPPGIDSVVARKDGTELVSVTPRVDTIMMHSQENVVIEARCLGLDGVTLKFDHCVVSK
jgi:hypothetical protein